MVKMSPEEEEAFTTGKTDFSIIYSTRVGGMSLLLGPARFVNHDCDPNSRFSTTNKDNVNLILLRDVKIGEEVTVFYAQDYFGVNNQECLCRSCEVEGRNGWAETVEEEVKEEHDEDNNVVMEDAPDASMALRRTRSKRKPEEPVDAPAPVEKKAKRKPEKDDVLTPPYSDRAPSEEARPTKTAVAVIQAEAKPFNPAYLPPTPMATHSASSALSAINTELARTEAADIAESLLALAQSPGFHKPLTFSPQTARPRTYVGGVVTGGSGFARVLSYEGSNLGRSSSWGPSQASSPILTTTTTTTVTTPTYTPAPGYIQYSAQETVILSQHRETTVATPAPLAQVAPEPTLPDQSATAPAEPESDLSEISDSELKQLVTKAAAKKEIKTEESNTEEFNIEESNTEEPKTEPKQTKRQRSSEASSRRKSVPPPAFYEPVRKRVPGDYINFFDSSSVSITCTDCNEVFIHNDRWYVPRSCRRCDRHSKIYGFVWPKTAKRKGDTEVRAPPRRRSWTKADHGVLGPDR